jgi:hypothetical protein
VCTGRQVAAIDGEIAGDWNTKPVAVAAGGAMGARLGPIGEGLAHVKRREDVLAHVLLKLLPADLLHD